MDGISIIIGIVYVIIYRIKMSLTFAATLSLHVTSNPTPPLGNTVTLVLYVFDKIV
jgi:hypothetical protein